MPSESDIQAAIIEALVFDGWLVLRINQGGRHGGLTCPTCYGAGYPDCRTCKGDGEIKSTYTRFAFWQMLGQSATDKGISDIVAVKEYALPPSIHMPSWLTKLITIEVKAPGKGDKLKVALKYRYDDDLFPKMGEHEWNQARYLWAVQDHGGIAIVADCLEDVEPYLDSVEVQ